MKRFNIAAGPLDGGIAAYEAQTGLKVTTSLPAGTLGGFQTKGVQGLHPEEEALRLLLEGTGLQFVQQDSTTMSVGLRRDDSVTVTSSVTDSISMMKFTEPLIDTPQTIAVLPQFVLKDDANTTLRDALRNVPGISMAAGEAGAQGDNLTIRGFTARNDIFLDGIRDFGSYYRDSFNFDQVEVLEGPSGVQFGRGSTGGVINQESKGSDSAAICNCAGAQFGTDATMRVTVDANKTLPDVGGGMAMRVNGMGMEAGVAGQPYAEEKSALGSCAFAGAGDEYGDAIHDQLLSLYGERCAGLGLPWFFNGAAPGGSGITTMGFRTRTI